MSVGRSVNQFVTSDMGYLAKGVADSLAKTIERTNMQYFFSVEADVLAKAIAENINKELLRIGQFIAVHLVGIRSGSDYDGTTSVDAFPGTDIEVDWRNLSRFTVSKKEANKNRFFLHTGDLKGELRSKVGPGLVKLNGGFRTAGMRGGVTYGPVSIRPYYFTSSSGRRVYKIADISVNLLSGANAGSIRSVLTQTVFNEHQGYWRGMPTLARQMGLSEAAVEKLEGAVFDRDRRLSPRKRSAHMIGVSEDRTGSRRQYYRPLLEPAIAYYFTVKVPRAIERVVNRYRRGSAPASIAR